MKTLRFFLFGLVACSASAAITKNLPNAQSGASITMDQLGAVAGKQYQGDGLTISRTSNGARLRCVFQRLEGEATPDGLWLSSTAEGSNGERLRVVAAEVGRTDNFGAQWQSAAAIPLFKIDWLAEPFADSESGVARCFPPQSKTLPVHGGVLVNDQSASFIRPGLTEEYSVSMDGVR